MPYSYALYTGNGSTTDFVFNFPYLSQTHVKVYVNGVLQVSGYSLVTTTGPVRFTNAPANGVSVRIQRETPLGAGDRPVVFENGAGINEDDLNTAFLQNLYAQQEIEDRRGQVLRAPSTEGALSEIPPKAARAGKIQSFDNDGQPSVTDPQALINAATSSAADSAAAAASSSLSAAGAALLAGGAQAAAESAQVAAESAAASINPALFAQRNMSGDAAGTGIMFAGGANISGNTGALTISAGGVGSRHIHILPLGRGNVSIGSGSGETDEYRLGLVGLLDDNNSGSGQSFHAMEDGLLITRTGTIGYASFASEPKVQGATNYDHIHAFQAKAIFGFSGTCTRYAGFDFQPQMLGGDVTNMYGLRVRNFDKTSGTLTNFYAIYSEGVTRGTNNWLIYAIGASMPSYHAGVWRQGGNLAVGVSDTEALPGVKLWVKGGSPTSVFAADTGNDVVVIDHGVASTINFRNNSADSAWLYWSDPAARGVGRFGYLHSTDSFQWYSGGALRATLNSTNFDLDVKLRIDDTTDSTTGPTGALVCLGGAYFDKRVITAASIQTGSPSAGTTQPWKLGSLLTGGSYSTDGTKAVEIEINGTAVKLAVLS